MKLKLITLIFISLILFSCQQKDGKITAPKVNSYDQLISIFSDPPSEYRPAPLWVWNKRVSKEDIDRSLRDLKKRGFGGVFIHPRYGLMTEYL